MKKILCLSVACILALSLFSACGKKVNEADAKTDTVVSESNVKTDSIATESDTKNETSKKENKEKTKKEDVKKENSKKEEASEPPLKPSENKEVVTAKTAPEIHIITEGGTNNARISYHLADCELLKGTEQQKATWEMIEMIQYRQCPECNPPRYEDYVE